MFSFLIVGENGAGKTTLAKQFLKLPEHKIIFDITDEYSDYYRKPGFSFHMDKKNLLSEADHKRNCILLIDEATSFFSYRGYNEDLLKLIQLRRHNNHMIIMMYLGFKFVPEYIRILFNFAIVFKTNDKADFVKDNFPYVKEIPTTTHRFNLYRQH